MLDNFMDKPFETQSVTAISDDLYEIAYGQPFRFPATFTFVMRAFSTLEGVGKGLDPEFNFMEVAKPYAMQLMNGNQPEAAGDLLGELGRQAAQMSSTALGLPRRIDDTIEKLDRGDLRLRVRATETDRVLRRLSNAQVATNYSILTGSFALCSAILVGTGYGWFAVIPGGIGLLPAIALLRLLRRMDRYEKMF
jgi:predicted unusual protein kinase regulating ubiquinone biosynthesis (AarF/ABC1/UbiB family)